jgi:PAS domain S-box-containing protein
LQEKIDELETAQRNLESILDNISDAILILDRMGNILSCNNQARKVFNCSNEDKTQISILELSDEEVNVLELDTIWTDVVQGSTRVMEWAFRQLHSGKRLLMHVSINRTSWNGEPAMVSVLRDFTAQKQHEQDLILARKKAEESDRLKSAFLANLSHEIRTPMNAIMGFTEFLKRSDLTSDKRETYSSIVRESGHHLLSILDDIIEISKIDTGQVAPNCSAVNIKSCIADVYKTMKITIPHDKKIRFRLHDNYAGTGLIIRTDRIKLRQILANLITNAIKYTERGTVTLRYEIISDNKEITFFVEDTGEGIDQKFHSIIFDRFSRLDSELAMKTGGSGLGLAISKAYVEMLGGTIRLQSELGRGSVFSFTIPLQEAQETVTGKEEMANEYTRGNKELILIAEDDDTNYLYFSKIFAAKNYRILRAKNGKEAVEMALQNNEIRLVLMDIKMPVLNGIEALKLIRQSKPDLPVIAQTAHALPDEEKQITCESFNGYLTKPINQQVMFRKIHQLLHQ